MDLPLAISTLQRTDRWIGASLWQATGVFNVACGRSIRITDLALTISNLTKFSSTIECAAERPGDVKDSVAGVDRIQRAGFTPVCDLAGGLRATIEFFRQDMTGIKQDRHL